MQDRHKAKLRATAAFLFSNNYWLQHLSHFWDISKMDPVSSALTFSSSKSRINIQGFCDWHNCNLKRAINHQPRWWLTCQAGIFSLHTWQQTHRRQKHHVCTKPGSAVLLLTPTLGLWSLLLFFLPRLPHWDKSPTLFCSRPTMTNKSSLSEMTNQSPLPCG